MVGAAAVDFEGSVELLYEDEPDDLVGKREGREAPAAAVVKPGRQAFGASDGKRDFYSAYERNKFEAKGFAGERLSFWVEGDEAGLSLSPFGHLHEVFGEEPL